MVEKRFEKLGMPDIERFENYLPTAFNSELTLLQKVNKIIFDLIETNKLTNEMVDYLNTFIETFDENLYNSVDDILSVWYATGKFEDLFKSKIFKDFLNELENKRDKGVKISRNDMDTSSDDSKLNLNNLSDEVIKAMSGETPVNPIIEDRSLDGYKLKRKTITEEEIKWLVNNYNLNLFDGVYRKGSVRAGAEGFYLEGTENSNYKLAVVTVKPKTTYYILRELPSRCNIATSSKPIKEKETFDGAVSGNYSGSGVSYYPQYIEITTGPNDKYLYLSMSIENKEPYLCISENPPQHNIRYYYNQPNKTVDIHNETNSINMYNLFNGDYNRDISIEGVEPFKLISRGGGRTAVIPILPNTDYTLMRETPSRLNWGTSTKLLELNEGLDGSLKFNMSDFGTSESPKIYHFRTGVNDKFLYVNTSVDNSEPILKVVEGTTYNLSLNYYEKKLNNAFKTFLNDYINQNVTTKFDARKIVVSYQNPNLFEIFVPTSNNRYIKYEYRYIDSITANMHQWRVLKVYVTDNNFNILFDLDSQTEWEGAIKEVGQPDYMGGTHGDETNYTANFFIDGKEITLDKSFKIECEDVKFIMKSLLNRPTDTKVNLLDRIKINHWTMNDYSVENIYKCLNNFEIFESKISLMSCRYENPDGNLISYGYKNTDFKVEKMSKENIGTLADKVKDATMFLIAGDNISMEIQCIADFKKYPNGVQHIQNFNQDAEPRAKVYFDVTGNYQIKKDEILRNKSIFTIMG